MNHSKTKLKETNKRQDKVEEEQELSEELLNELILLKLEDVATTVEETIQLTKRRSQMNRSRKKLKECIFNGT